MTTPTEREVLIAALRTLRPSPAECDLAADMLATDAQEIELLKEKVAYEQALGDKHFAAHTRLQAELDGIRGQEAVANVTVSKWRGLGNVEWQEQVELPDGTNMLYLAAGAQQVAQITEVAIDEFLEDYELRGEDEDGRDACHQPTETERALIKDAIMGLLAAAPQPPQAERVPMTETELEDGFNSPSVDVAPTDSVESVFIEGARFAERHHGIGGKP